MPHLPPAHHETSKHDSPNETKIKEKQNKIVPDSNSNLAKSMTHHNQIKERTTWFLRKGLGQSVSCPFIADGRVRQSSMARGPGRAAAIDVVRRQRALAGWRTLPMRVCALWVADRWGPHQFEGTGLVLLLWAGHVPLGQPNYLDSNIFLNFETESVL
jgi:hypothetical protein